ncbi:MAG: DUF3489 domain-containing protein [Magnetococcales bacterium]|nr:DUF3489 domain-containing protein [Magnetococcales bacterium]
MILMAATTREDGSIHPMPDHIKGGAVNKVLTSLRAKGLITEDDKIPMHTLMVLDPDFKSARGQYLNRSEAERQAKEDAEIVAAQQGMVWDWQVQANEPPAATTLETNNDVEAEVATAEQAIAKTPKARDNTKKAKVIEMLKRPEGATAAQIAAATGWQGHYADAWIMPM